MNWTIKRPALAIGLALIAASSVAKAEPIPLSDSDRENIETYLGKGVVGEAVEGNPIGDAGKFFSFENRSWVVEFSSGDRKGETETQSFEKLKRDAEGTTGRYTAGGDRVLYMLRNENGDISITSEQDTKQGVVSHFSPAQPIYVGHLDPGQSQTAKIDVKVYDLSSPDELAHEGYLDLTLTYVGAYKVTVPAGAYDAALLRWEYKGKVGPANIEDTQYRFLVETVGSVAMIEQKSISAMLIYHDNSKYGKVLIKSE